MKLDDSKIIATRKDKVIYRDGDKSIKVFNEAVSKSDVLNEALNNARVEETGLNVPKVREVALIEGKWSIVTDFIDGDTIAHLTKDAPKKFDEYMELFVDTQLEIHSKRAPLLNKLKDKMIRKMGESGLDATTRYELLTRLESMPKHVKVCHGDYNAANVIIAKDGTPFIIDWAHATQGNASADVARTYLLFCLKGENVIADKYLKMFCTKSDTPRQYVQRWLPIVAASQLVKGKPEEKEFLTNWASVVEYE